MSKDSFNVRDQIQMLLFDKATPGLTDDEIVAALGEEALMALYGLSLEGLVIKNAQGRYYNAPCPEDTFDFLLMYNEIYRGDSEQYLVTSDYSNFEHLALNYFGTMLRTVFLREETRFIPDDSRQEVQHIVDRDEHGNLVWLDDKQEQVKLKTHIAVTTVPAENSKDWKDFQKKGFNHSLQNNLARRYQYDVGYIMRFTSLGQFLNFRDKFAADLLESADSYRNLFMNRYRVAILY